MARIKYLDDIDEEHDLTDRIKFTETMKREDEASKAPCMQCPMQDGCVMPVYCEPYQAWRRKYLRNKLR